MIDYKYYDLFDKSSVDKQLKIVCSDGTILTNKNFHLHPVISHCRSHYAPTVNYHLVNASPLV